MKKEDFNQALADINQAVQLNPKDGFILASRAKIYFKMKDYFRAWEDVHEAQGMGHKLDDNFIEELKSVSGRDQ
jgi:regulator of sirC expression with transglutaminase-like and TPR domain